MDDCLPFKDTSYFSSLILDYLEEDKKTKPFYGRFPNLENFEKQARDKQKNVSTAQRKILVERLKEQYSGFNQSEATVKNIENLQEQNTFTITTGHQLNLFTGPLYFFYKIISTLNTCEEWNRKQDNFRAVPIFWMASEDHDFEEINFFHYRRNPVVWQEETGGPVGRFSTGSINQVLEQFSGLLDDSKQAQDLLALFKNAYQEHTDLAGATRFLANELFGEYGLVIVDGDDRKLKNQFLPFVKDELLKRPCDTYLQKTNKALKDAGYHLQVQQREINLFYLKDGLRKRIVFDGEVFAVLETDLKFTEREILSEVEAHPERFSPNAVMRPLYQEAILPNLCYIGGGGELAYWFQLKAYFENQKVDFPILQLRNSALLLSGKQERKLKKLGRAVADLFQDKSELCAQHTKAISKIDIDFSPQKKHLQKQFSDLYELAEKTDASFKGAVAAQEKKQLNGLKHLEKRLLTAQKRKLNAELERLTELQGELFPDEKLQERTANFSTFYREKGGDLIPFLKQNLKPLDFRFNILRY